jgi:hypothetical protein
MRPLTVALVGAAIGVPFAAVQAYANGGDISPWEWVLLPLLAAGLINMVGGYFDRSRNYTYWGRVYGCHTP